MIRSVIEFRKKESPTMAAKWIGIAGSIGGALIAIRMVWWMLKKTIWSIILSTLIGGGVIAFVVHRLLAG